MGPRSTLPWSLTFPPSSRPLFQTSLPSPNLHHFFPRLRSRLRTLLPVTIAKEKQPEEDGCRFPPQPQLPTSLDHCSPLCLPPLITGDWLRLLGQPTSPLCSSWHPPTPTREECPTNPPFSLCPTPSLLPSFLDQPTNMLAFLPCWRNNTLLATLSLPVPSLPPSLLFFFFTREVLKCVFILISLIPLFLHLLKPLQSDFCCHLSNQTYHEQGPWDLNIAPFRAKRPCPSHLTCSRMTCECAVHAGTYLRGNGGLGMITPGPQVQTGIVQGKWRHFSRFATTVHSLPFETFLLLPFRATVISCPPTMLAAPCQSFFTIFLICWSSRQWGVAGLSPWTSSLV